MPTIDSQGKQVEVDEDGYLIDLDDWTKELGEAMAKQDGCDLTDAHWEVINFLREYYQKYQIAPNTKYLYELYPDGPAKQACRYAGLPKPTGCV